MGISPGYFMVLLGMTAGPGGAASGANGGRRLSFATWPLGRADAGLLDGEDQRGDRTGPVCPLTSKAQETRAIYVPLNPFRTEI
jgi:hypothetical protein